MVWLIVGIVVAALLLAGALMDRNARRRGGRVLGSSDIWYQVREADRDSRVIDNSVAPPAGRDSGWTSWGRRNSGGR